MTTKKQIWPPRTYVKVIRLRPNTGAGTSARISTTRRLVQGIEAIRSALWFDATGWVTIAGRCVIVRRPIGWACWVYFESKP